MRWTWMDCVVGSVLVVLLGTFTIAQMADQEEIAKRVKCQSNMRMVGQALLLYANENRGRYPRTIAATTDPKPVWGTPYEGNDKLAAKANANPFDAKMPELQPKGNDVTAAMFLLLRTQDMPADAFVCPSTGSDVFDYGGKGHRAQDWTNWPGKKSLADHLSYSMQNPYPTPDAIGKGLKWNNTLRAEYAIAADLNPGVDALLKLNVRSPFAEMKRGNSPNHAGDGQNVLYGDGHCAYEQNPFVGVMRDNIYTFGESGGDGTKAGEGIVGSSVGPDDSILLPTAKDLGVVDAEGKVADAYQKRREGLSGDLKPGTPTEQDAARKKFMGSYSRDDRGRKVKLTITADKVTASTGPLTIAFDYKIGGLSDSGTRLDLTAPDTPPGHVTIHVEPDGVTMKGTMYFEGAWKRSQ